MGKKGNNDRMNFKENAETSSIMSHKTTSGIVDGIDGIGIGEGIADDSYPQFLRFFQQLESPDFHPDPALIRLLSDHAEIHHYNKKELLISKGEPQSYLYFLVSGVIRCFSVKEDGHELTNHIGITPGSPFIAAASLEENDAALDWVQALTDSTDIAVPLKVIRAAREQFPEINAYATAAMGESFKQYLTLMKVRSMKAEDRCRWLREEHPELLSVVQKQYLASLLDMDKAVYSRFIHSGNCSEKHAENHSE